MANVDVEREEELRKLRAKFGTLIGGVPKPIFDKLDMDTKIYVRCKEAIARATLVMPRTFKGAITTMIVVHRTEQAIEQREKAERRARYVG